MSNINTLRENYGDVINRHTEIINNKANTFEESYIYQNDILNVKEQKFDNISVCFQALRNKVNYIKNSINRETEFNNIAVSLDNLISKFDMCIDTLQENSKKINLASKAAFEEYLTDFKTVNDEWVEKQQETNNLFTQHDDLNKSLNRKKNSLYRAQLDMNTTEVELLKSECATLEDDLNEKLNNISSSLRYLKNNNDKLGVLLDEALKKGTAV